MDSDRENSENEFGYINFSIHISKRTCIRITTFTFQRIRIQTFQITTYHYPSPCPIKNKSIFFWQNSPSFAVQTRSIEQFKSKPQTLKLLRTTPLSTLPNTGSTVGEERKAPQSPAKSFAAGRARTAAMPPGQLHRRAASAWGGDRACADADEVVMVRRSAVAPCVTCGLCGGILRDATTVSECLHSCELLAHFLLSTIARVRQRLGHCARVPPCVEMGTPPPICACVFFVPSPVTNKIVLDYIVIRRFLLPIWTSVVGEGVHNC
jgi:hypothetical protein